jgi:hypothetical protein
MDRLEWTSGELLERESGLEPLIASGVRCHGGFDADGRYRSPRTHHRMPAIAAWQARLEREGHALVTIPDALLPPHHPNVAQAKLLLLEGVREPIVRALTMISIVEGFGAIIRDVPVPKLTELVYEPIAGTALAHLSSGLFEAHARDEAGHKDEGGHKQMWEAARDLALDSPKIPSDILMRMMGGARARTRRERGHPMIDETLENMLATMVSVLVIEVFARGTFDWGEQLLSDPAVSAKPTEAGAMVGYIRSDEAPHVEYLRTALSEVRARTLRTVDGKTIAGRTIVDAMLHRTLAFTTKQRPEEQRRATRDAIAGSLEKVADPARARSLLEHFEALETPFSPSPTTGFEAAE